MTLALIVLLAVSANIVEIPRPSARQDPPSTQQAPASSQQPSDQGSQGGVPPSSNPTPATKTVSKPTSTQQKKPAKKHHKKKLVVQNCDVNASGAAASAETSGTQAATAGQNAQKPCTPPKKIVRHGGASDPSIQLAGDQPPNEREATNQMLTATDGNLKKLEGRQLSSSQKDMVGQVRQFMEQSRSAMESGDFARSRTLAWKAQLLSEELVNPK